MPKGTEARHRVTNGSGAERLSHPLFYDPDFAASVDPLPIDDKDLIREAIAYYQIANQMFREGEMREDHEEEDDKKLEGDGALQVDQQTAP